MLFLKFRGGYINEVIIIFVLNCNKDVIYCKLFCRSDFFFYFRYFKDMVKGEILLVKERFEMLIVI